MSKEKKISNVFKELRELGSAWDDVICVCRGLMKDNPCEVKCNEFFDETLTNSREEKKKEEFCVLAICDGCGREIMDNEVALARAGIFCFECCRKMWGD